MLASHESRARAEWSDRIARRKFELEQVADRLRSATEADEHARRVIGENERRIPYLRQQVAAVRGMLEEEERAAERFVRAAREEDARLFRERTVPLASGGGSLPSPVPATTASERARSGPRSHLPILPPTADLRELAGLSPAERRRRGAR